MSIATIRAAMADDLATVADLRPVEYVQDQVTVNQAVIARGRVDYHLTFGKASQTKHTYTFNVLVYVNRSNPRTAQIALDGFCEPATGIPNAIETGTNLPNVCDYAKVVSASEVREATIGQTDYLLVEFEVEVCA